MIGRFLDGGHWAQWVAGDEIYVGNPKLRAALEERGCGYVLTVARTDEVLTRGEKFRGDALAKKLPKRAWQKLVPARPRATERHRDRRACHRPRTPDCVARPDTSDRGRFTSSPRRGRRDPTDIGCCEVTSATTLREG